MNELSLAVFLALAALLLGGISLFVFYVVVNRERNTEGNKVVADRELSPKSDAASTESPPRSGARPRRQHKKKGIEKSQRYLFVVFDEPGLEANRALGQLLSDVKAFYEAGLGIYHVPPGPEGYPLTVANASSPGKLPPLHLSGDHPPVQGVSILIKFINSRSVSRSPETLISFTHRVAEIGGRILDVERKPVTEETFAELRGDAQ